MEGKEKEEEEEGVENIEATLKNLCSFSLTEVLNIGDLEIVER